MAVHIGNEIRETLENRSIGVSDFARKIGLSRNVVYNIFERESINTELLYRISKVLKHDFFKYYSKDLKKKV